MGFESQTHPQDDHIGRIAVCSTRYGQARAVSTRGRLAKGRWAYSVISQCCFDVVLMLAVNVTTINNFKWVKQFEPKNNANVD